MWKYSKLMPLSFKWPLIAINPSISPTGQFFLRRVRTQDQGQGQHATPPPRSHVRAAIRLLSLPQRIPLFRSIQASRSHPQNENDEKNFILTLFLVVFYPTYILLLFYPIKMAYFKAYRDLKESFLHPARHPAPAFWFRTRPKILTRSVPGKNGPQIVAHN